MRKVQDHHSLSYSGNYLKDGSLLNDTLKPNSSDILLNGKRIENLEVNEILCIYLNKIRQKLINYENSMFAKPLLPGTIFTKDFEESSNSDEVGHLAGMEINPNSSTIFSGHPHVARFYKMYFFMNQLNIPF